jgi:hypothetical protein
MEEQKQPDTAPGSTKAEATKQEVVEKKPVETPDYEAMLKAKDDRIAILARDRDNYRAGMLKYKKESEQEIDSSEDDRIKQMIREEMLNSELAKEQAEKDAIIQTIAKENRELKIAMANKAQISNLPGGSSQTQEESKGEELTNDQKAYFDKLSREIGVKVDPKKFLENWKKIKNNK